MTTTQTTGRPDADLLPPLSREAVLDNTLAVLPVVEQEAGECDRIGRLTPRMAQTLRAAGLFEMGYPADRGGLEMSLVDQVRVVAAIARVDAGIGWNVGVLNASGYYAGRLGEEAYAELYPTRDRPTSGSFHPRGRAEVTDGGYLVSGRWDWGSGSYIADHIVGGCLVYEDGRQVMGPTGAPLVLGVWLPRDAVQHLDNWHTVGVRGSGSASYVIRTPAFVPAAHTFDREAVPSADRNPLNKHVTTAFFPLTGVCLGLGRHLLDIAIGAQRAKAGERGSGGVDPISRLLLGQVITEVDTMEAAVTEIAAEADRVLFTPGRHLDPVLEARLTATNPMTSLVLERILPLCQDLAGSRYLFQDHPMERVIRDVAAAKAHAGAKRTMMLGVADAAIDHPDAASTAFEQSWRRDA